MKNNGVSTKCYSIPGKKKTVILCAVSCMAHCFVLNAQLKNNLVAQWLTTIGCVVTWNTALTAGDNTEMFVLTVIETWHSNLPCSCCCC